MRQWILHYGILLTIAVMTAGATIMLCTLKTHQKKPVIIFTTGPNTAKVYLSEALQSDEKKHVKLISGDGCMTVMIDSLEQERNATVLFVSNDNLAVWMNGNTYSQGYIQGQAVTLIQLLFGK